MPKRKKGGNVPNTAVVSAQPMVNQPAPVSVVDRPAPKPMVNRPAPVVNQPSPSTPQPINVSSQSKIVEESIKHSESYFTIIKDNLVMILIVIVLLLVGFLFIRNYFFSKEAPVPRQPAATQDNTNVEPEPEEEPESEEESGDNTEEGNTEEQEGFANYSDNNHFSCRPDMYYQETSLLIGYE